MQLYSVMLCLQMYYFFDSTFRESRNAGILKAYNTALSFVSFLSQNLYLLGPYIPTWIIRSLATVCGIHIKVLNSSLSQFVNAAEGVASFQTTTEFLRRCSVGEGDICVRVPNVISQLWQLCQGPLLQHNIEPTMEVQSRLGASMIFEIITLWRKGCQMVKARIDKSSSDVGEFVLIHCFLDFLPTFPSCSHCGRFLVLYFLSRLSERPADDTSSFSAAACDSAPAAGGASTGTVAGSLDGAELRALSELGLGAGLEYGGTTMTSQYLTICVPHFI